MNKKSRFHSGIKLSKVVFSLCERGILSSYYYYDFLDDNFVLDELTTYCNQECENDGIIYRYWISSLRRAGIVSDLSAFPLETLSLATDREIEFDLQSRVNSWHSNWFLLSEVKLAHDRVFAGVFINKKLKMSYLKSSKNVIDVEVRAQKISEYSGANILLCDGYLFEDVCCQIDLIEVLNSEMTIRYINEIGEKNALIAAQRMDEFIRAYGKKALSKYQKYKISIITRRMQIHSYRSAVNGFIREFISNSTNYYKIMESESGSNKAFDALDRAIDVAKYEISEKFNKQISIFALFLATISFISTIISVIEFSLDEESIDPFGRILMLMPFVILSLLAFFVIIRRK